MLNGIHQNQIKFLKDFVRVEKMQTDLRSQWRNKDITHQLKQMALIKRFKKIFNMNENVENRPHLFHSVDFKSHSGLDLSWKIEMDALSDPEWFTLSKMILELSPPFKEAVGIPRGGMKLGNLLNSHGTGKRKDPILIVDDVLTTGLSMEEFKQKRHWRNPTDYIGWVVFARVKCPDWVTALFQMPPI